MARGHRLDQLYYDIEARTDKLGPGLAASERRLKRFAGVIRQHPLAALGALAATAAIVSVRALQMSADFDAAMSQATSALATNRGEIEEYKRALLDLSRRVPRALQDLQGGLSVLGQVGGRDVRGDPAAAIQRLEIASRAAVASGASIEEVIRGLDDVMDAFSLSGNEAAQQVLNLSFGVAQGRAPFGEFLQQLATAAPYAAAAGVSLGSVTATIGTLYEAGVSATDITKSLKQELTGIREEGGEVTTSFDRLGIRVEKVGDNLVVTGNLASQYAEAANEAANANTALAETFDQINEGTGSRWQLAMNRVRGIVQGLADDVAGPLAKLLSVFEWLDRQAEAARNRTGFVPGAIDWMRRRGQSPFEDEGSLPPPGRQPPPTPAPNAAGATGNQGGRRPLTDAERARIANERARLTEQLMDRVAAATMTAAEAAARELDALARRVVEVFGTRVPAEVQQALEQIRAQSLSNQDLENFADGLQVIEKELDKLASMQEVGTAEWMAQGRAADDLIGSLYRYTQALEEGTESHRQAVALLEQARELQRRVREEKEREAAAADKTFRVTGRTLDALQAQARNIEAAVRGGLQLAAAMGLVSDRSSEFLRNIAQVAANVPGLAKALADFGKPGYKVGAAEIVGAALPVAGGLAALVGGMIGDSPEDIRRREIMRSNTEAIEQLTTELGNFGRQVTGNQSRGAEEVARRAVSVSPFGYGNQLPRFLQEAGLSMAEFRNIARELGITFADTLPSVSELNQMLQALGEADIGQMRQDLQGALDQMGTFFALFDIEDPIKQLQEFVRAIETVGERADQQSGSPALRGVVQGLDLTTAAGRAEAEHRIQQLYSRIRFGGGLNPEEMGSLTLEQLIQALLTLESTIDAANAEDTGGATETFGLNRSVTEVTGSRIAAYLATIAQTSQRAAEILQRILERPAVHASVLPPTWEEMDRFMGRTGGGHTTNINIELNVHVSGAMDPAAARQTGQLVGEAAARAINQELGAMYRRRARALGRPALPS